MKTLGNILWYFPFFGFVNAALVYLLGVLLTATVVAAPIGLGLMEFGKFLFAPFGRTMVSKSDLNLEQNQAWKAYSTLVTVIYFPFGIFLAICAVIQVALLCFTVVGIPVALVIAKSLGTYLNPINKKCVSSAVSDELARRRGHDEVEKYLGPKNQEKMFEVEGGSVTKGRDIQPAALPPQLASTFPHAAKSQNAQSVFCTECGIGNEFGGSFCSNCGAKL